MLVFVSILHGILQQITQFFYSDNAYGNNAVGNSNAIQGKVKETF